MYTTDNFIKHDFTSSTVTPKLCANMLHFKESNPGISKDTYNEFHKLRAIIEETFNNPYNLEPSRYKDGYEVRLYIDFVPSKWTWKLVERYFINNKWSEFHYDHRPGWNQLSGGPNLFILNVYA